MDKILLQELKNSKQFLLFVKLKKEFNEGCDIFNILTKPFVIKIIMKTFQKVMDEQDNITYDDIRQEAFKQCKAIQYLFPATIISSSFTWGATKQGHDFWREMHFKWVKYLADNVIRTIANKDAAQKFFKTYTRGY